MIQCSLILATLLEKKTLSRFGRLQLQTCFCCHYEI